MNRRSFLTFLGLAPAVVPLAAKGIGAEVAFEPHWEAARVFWRTPKGPRTFIGVDGASAGDLTLEYSDVRVQAIDRYLSDQQEAIHAMFKTDADFDSILDRYAEFKKTYDRIPKQARGPTQDEQLMTDPDEAQALKQIEAGEVTSS